MSLLVELLGNSSCSIRHPGWDNVLDHGRLKVGQLVAIRRGGLQGREAQTPTALGQSHSRREMIFLDSANSLV